MLHEYSGYSGLYRHLHGYGNVGISVKGYTGTLKGINRYSGVYGGEKGIHGYISTLQAVRDTMC